MDWNAVLQQAVTAAENVLAGNWNNISSAAQHSIAMLTQTAEYVAANPNIPALQQKLLIDNQKLAMQNTLLGFEGVGILIAEQAVAAAWSVVGQALQSTIQAAIKV